MATIVDRLRSLVLRTKNWRRRDDDNVSPRLFDRSIHSLSVGGCVKLIELLPMANMCVLCIVGTTQRLPTCDVRFAERSLNYTANFLVNSAILGGNVGFYLRV